MGLIDHDVAASGQGRVHVVSVMHACAGGDGEWFLNEVPAERA